MQRLRTPRFDHFQIPLRRSFWRGTDRALRSNLSTRELAEEGSLRDVAGTPEHKGLETSRRRRTPRVDSPESKRVLSAQYVKLLETRCLASGAFAVGSTAPDRKDISVINVISVSNVISVISVISVSNVSNVINVEEAAIS